jgi:hypothetical protein
LGRINLYLHIGLHKTGTTALQYLLLNNRSLLEQKGYLYPSTGLEDTPAHYGLAWSLDPNQKLPFSANEIWGRLRQEIKQSKAQNIVLSSEDFIILEDLEELRQVTEDYNVKIIVYLRRQDYLVQSMYNQLVREPTIRLTVTIQEFIQRNMYNVLVYLDFSHRLEVWKNNFGKNNIIVRVYEKAQLPEGIFADFLEVIGLDFTDEYVLPEKKVANISFDLDVLEFLRLLNSIPMTVSHHTELLVTLNSLSQKIGERDSDHRHLLFPWEQVELLERYKESNSQVAREYLGREDERLFYEAWPDPQDSQVFYPGLSIEKAIQIVTELKAKQLAEIGLSKEALLLSINKYGRDITEAGATQESIGVLSQTPDWIWNSLFINHSQAAVKWGLRTQEYNNKLLQAQLQVQETTLKQQEQELHELRTRLNDIYQTRAWWLITKYWTFKDKLQKIIQPYKLWNLDRKSRE